MKESLLLRYVERLRDGFRCYSRVNTCETRKCHFNTYYCFR